MTDSPASLELHALLANAGWIKRLALVLLGDDGLAGDVVQETWIRALQHPRKAEHRSWLATVTRNLALDRRRQRKRAGSPPAAELASKEQRPDEILGRADASRKLVDAVLDLPEPYRTTLLHRYFDDLSTRDVALKLDTPYHTVRTHLDRGLSMLRDRLKNSLGEAWRDSCAVIGLSDGLQSLTPLSATLPLLAMTTKSTLALLGGLTLAAAAVIYGMRESAPATPVETSLESSRPAPAPEAEPAKVEETRVALAGQADPSAAAVSNSEHFGAVLVQMLASNGVDPLPGISLRLELNHLDMRFQTLTGTTDSEGQVGFQVETPADLRGLTVLATADTPYLLHHDKARVEDGEEHRIEVVLPEPGWISGVVLDETGEPVAGAEVNGWFEVAMHAFMQGERPPERQTQTNASGRFTLGGLFGHFTLCADSPGRGSPYLVGGQLGAGQHFEDVVLRIIETRDVVVWVVDSSNAPVEGAEARVRGHWGSKLPFGPPGQKGQVRKWPSYQRRMTTDGHGRLVLPDLPRVPFDLNMGKVDHPSVELLLAPEQNQLEIVLPEGRTLHGVVTGTSGAPIPKASLELYSGGDWHQTWSDQAGGFTLQGIPAAGQQTEVSGMVLVARAPGHSVRVEVLAPPSHGLEALAIELETEWKLSGKVVDSDGGPVPGAALRITGDRMVGNPEWSWSLATMPWEQVSGQVAEGLGQLAETRTNRDGEFEFHGLYDGLFSIEVTVHDLPVPAASVQSRSGQDPLYITLGDGLEAFVSLAGRVLDARTGQPVEDFEVRLQRDQERLLPKSFADPDGDFAFQGLDPGDYWISVKAGSPSRLATRRLGPLTPGSWTEDFLLEATREIHLKTVDAEGNPVRAWVELHDGPGREMGKFKEPGLLEAKGADNDGLVSFSEVPAASVWVVGTLTRPQGMGSRCEVRPNDGGSDPVILVVD
ncbi:MAG: sigma-70 family RNA polymerase sigma factor [Planctomycetes bacterium]|nr:sigma-70 family RNA polymerase sigma factor [Planctomycetota bacterium]MBL7008495.1 sigma-70 family RNA polymerase sigma factor [Planctomycetota bacterium]